MKNQKRYTGRRHRAALLGCLLLIAWVIVLTVVTSSAGAVC